MEIFILLGSGSQASTSPSRLQGTEPTITTISNFQVCKFGIYYVISIGSSFPLHLCLTIISLCSGFMLLRSS